MRAPFYSQDSCQITSKREWLFIVALEERVRMNIRNEVREAPVVERSARKLSACQLG